MLSQATGLSSAAIILKGDELLPESAQAKLQSYLQRRSTREPLQHILGETSFMGLRFKVGPQVLIPRPETEILVQIALAYLEQKFGGQAKILDIGAGSGAICLSLLYFCKQSQAVASEISQAAADICQANARTLGVSERLTVERQDILDAFLQTDKSAARDKFDLFVSNPPYIPDQLINGLEPEVRDFEPRLALVGEGEDGLGFYRAFARHLPALASGPDSAIVAEFGQGQGEAIETIFAAANWREISLLPDLAGISRVLLAVCPKETL